MHENAIILLSGHNTGAYRLRCGIIERTYLPRAKLEISFPYALYAHDFVRGLRKKKKKKKKMSRIDDHHFGADLLEKRNCSSKNIVACHQWPRKALSQKIIVHDFLNRFQTEKLLHFSHRRRRHRQLLSSVC